MVKIIEEFRIIPSFKKYLASNLGNIKNSKTGRILIPFKSFTKKGKPHKKKLSLRDSNGKLRTLGVHQFVMEAFSEKPNGTYTIDHKDRNPFNNELINLRWATHKEQLQNRDSAQFYNRAIPTLRKSRKITMNEINEMYLFVLDNPLYVVAERFNMNVSAVNTLLLYMHPNY